MRPGLPPPPLEMLPLPAPAGLLQALWWLSSLAFLVPAALALGWPLMTLAAETLGYGRVDTSLRRLAAWLARRTSGAVALAVALGFPPLLLEHLLTGRAGVTATLRLGWIWAALLPLLLAGGGGAFWVALRRRGTEPSTLRPFLPDVVESYLLAFRRRGLERPGFVLTALVELALLLVGFILVAHAVLLLDPVQPAQLSWQGLDLPLRNPHLLPRLLFELLGACAIAGAAVAWHGADRMADGESAYGRTALRYGAIWCLVPALLQAAVGPWFVYSLPLDLSRDALGGSTAATALFWSGLGAAGLAALAVGLALAAREPRPYVWAAATLLLADAGAQVAVRQQLLAARLGGLAGLGTRPVAAQPLMAAAFAITAALVAAAIAYMLWAASAAQARQREG